MSPFLAAQADDPFDPTSMLIHADWLEERGDVTGAAVLRALSENGTPSLPALALNDALCSLTDEPDRFDERASHRGRGFYGSPRGDVSGVGIGDGYVPEFGADESRADGVGYGDGHDGWEKGEPWNGCGSASYDGDFDG